MFTAGPTRINVSSLDALDETLAKIPNVSAVFLLSAAGGEPYLGRTGNLQRRLSRLLRRRERPSKLLHLRDKIVAIEYWLAPSRLESALTLYELARRHQPDSYLDFLKLRMPPYVKLLLANRFPRTQVTARLSSGPGLYYGPFRTRASAEQFEHEFLDLFQLRRCQEDLEPHADHPGCIYGEMSMCLRPCQAMVTSEEYASEVIRIQEFLSSGGKHMLRTIQNARDRLSEEMNFEEAARQHKRYERVEEILKLRDELSGNIDTLSGVAVTPSNEEGVVRLWFLLEGCWLSPMDFDAEAARAENTSLDKRLRETASGLTSPRLAPRERQEHLALLARWFYSSWRDGEWIPFEDVKAIPYRRLVSAISRVLRSADTAH